MPRPFRDHEEKTFAAFGGLDQSVRNYVRAFGDSLVTEPPPVSGPLSISEHPPAPIPERIADYLEQITGYLARIADQLEKLTGHVDTQHRPKTLFYRAMLTSLGATTGAMIGGAIAVVIGEFASLLLSTTLDSLELFFAGCVIGFVGGGAAAIIYFIRSG